jgi:hypothetical protein
MLRPDAALPALGCSKRLAATEGISTGLAWAVTAALRCDLNRSLHHP